MALIVPPAGIDSPEDLSILYSNRAACYLKDGNSTDCIQDCSKYLKHRPMCSDVPDPVWMCLIVSFFHLSDPLRALELQPFCLKPLLRRAMAYESLERYRKAYVDYKTVLQIDTGVQAAHDSVHRLADDSKPQLASGFMVGIN